MEKEQLIPEFSAHIEQQSLVKQNVANSPEKNQAQENERLVTLIKELADQREQINRTKETVNALETQAKNLLKEATNTQDKMSWIQTLTYLGFFILLVMVAGMLLDFFSSKENLSSYQAQPIIIYANNK